MAVGSDRVGFAGQAACLIRVGLQVAPPESTVTQWSRAFGNGTRGSLTSPPVPPDPCRPAGVSVSLLPSHTK